LRYFADTAESTSTTMNATMQTTSQSLHHRGHDLERAVDVRVGVVGAHAEAHERAEAAAPRIQ
jgi:hypothetical protein